MDHSPHRQVMKSDTSGSGMDLVLVPGGLTGWLSWKPHAEVLSRSRRVTRVQLLNVELGLAAAPLPADYSVDYEIQALGNTLDALGIEQADLAAWSYGALITLGFAVRSPRRVRTLTLIEPPAYWLISRLGPLPPPVQEEREKLESIGPGQVSEDQLALFCHVAGFVAPDVDPRALPQWQSWSRHRQSLRLCATLFQYSGDYQQLRAFDQPALLVKGEGSTPVMHRIVDLLAEALPNARVIMLPGAHAAHVISIQPFLRELNQLLEQGEPPP